MMEALAGALSGANVWQTVVPGMSASDVSGALEIGMTEYETRHEADAPKPVAASVFYDGESNTYAVILMLSLPNHA